MGTKAKHKDVVYEGLNITSEAFDISEDGQEAMFTFYHAGIKFNYTGWLEGDSLVWIDTLPPGDSVSQRVCELLNGFAIGALVDRLGARRVAGKVGRDVPLRREGV